MNYRQAKPPNVPSHTSSYSAPRLRSIARRSVRRWAEINCDVCHTLFCMKPNLIVWDLETMPDLGRFAAANDLVASPTWKSARRLATMAPYSSRVSGLAGRSRLLDICVQYGAVAGGCKHRCGAREGLTRPGGILDGAMEKEVSNGSRHGPLPERIR
jgi:hypothetical protein